MPAGSDGLRATVAAERIRVDRPAAAAGNHPRRAAADRRLHHRLARPGDLLVVDLAPSRAGGGGAEGAAAARPGERRVSASHFLFIPAVLLVGIVVGWILGSRAARDAYAAEL